MNSRVLIENCLKKSQYPFVTATDIATYIKSPFNLWANKFAPSYERDPIPEYLEILFKQGLEHEEYIVKKRYPDIKVIKFKTKYDGFKIAVREFFKGTSALHGIPLYFLPDSLLAQPDIVELDKTHRSIFGNFHYKIKEIKMARNIKKEHIMQTVFSNYIIGKIQNYFPKHVILINKDDEELFFDYKEYEDELLKIMEEVREVLKGKFVSPNIGSVQDPWKSYALKLAEKSNDLSLLNTLGNLKKQILIKYGINNIYDLANLKITNDLDILTKDNLKKLKLAAQCHLDNKYIFLKKIKFPNKKTELFIDFESSTGMEIEGFVGNIDYLIGVLKRENNKEEIFHFFSESLEDEEKMLHDFLDFLKGYGDFVIYHFGNYENIRFRELFDKYDIDNNLREMVLKNMVDLLKITKDNVILPLSSYSLKSIAPYLGFKWRLTNIDARQSLVLYMDYIKNNNKESLHKILIYNEDDILATKILKDFLIKGG